MYSTFRYMYVYNAYTYVCINVNVHVYNVSQVLDQTQASWKHAVKKEEIKEI